MNAKRWCEDNLGFVPTEEQMEIYNSYDAGAVKLLLSIVDRQYFYRKCKQEKY